MSFGWVLATLNGDMLAKGAGPCSGRDNSLRSEGAGILTVTVLISLINSLDEIVLNYNAYQIIKNSSIE